MAGADPRAPHLAAGADIAAVNIMEFRVRMILTALFCLTGSHALAQQPVSPPPASSPPAAPISMEDPRQGDSWTFETLDEITGKVTTRRTDTVTEVTAAAIAVSFTTDKDKQGFEVFDRNWNAKTANEMRYTPNSALGVIQPLKVGASWPIRVEQTNTEKGFTWKWTGQSKVTGEEKITTKAGTFETFKIESSYVVYPVKNPARKSEFAMQTWYAPAINHWVLRTNTVRAEGMLRAKHRIELVAYSRKQ